MPADLATDPQFRARFDREARAISQLQHPHICTLYDVGEVDGTAFLVMELLQGQTLADRLTKGALPLDDALKIAIDVADALSAAHKQGIVHRDLKPANIMLTKAGAKLLDFGLAKAAAPVVNIGSSSTYQTASTHLTGSGTILGTLHYMSPEQVEGNEADARSDVFAFGATVYEMLTGKRAFDGHSQASVVAAILRGEPAPIASLQPLSPPVLDRIVAACLERDPDERWQSSRDLLRQLQWVADARRDVMPPDSTARGRRSRMITAGLMALVLIVAVFAITQRGSHRLDDQRVSQLAILTQVKDAAWIGAPGPSLAITPDGSTVAYIGNGGTELFSRPLDKLTSTSIATGGNLRDPFVSPDGRWIGVFDTGQFKRVPIMGGSAIPLSARGPGGPRGAAWLPDDTIVFATNDDSTGLMRLSVGQPDAIPETLTIPDKQKGEADHLYPAALPDGSGILFTITAQTGGLDAAQLALFDLRTRKITPLLKGARSGRYVSAGYVVYAAGSATLRAVPFDLKRREISGAPVAVLNGVRITGTGGADYAVAADGTLVYVAASTGVAGARSLVWVDRSGKETPLGLPLRSYAEPRISPDATRIAVFSADQENDIWIADVTRSPPGLSRMTSAPGIDQSPVWDRNGQRVYFASDRGPISGVFNVWSQRFDGTDRPERLTTTSQSQQFPVALSPDGHDLLVRETTMIAQRRVSLVGMGDHGARAFLRESQASTRNVAFSSDGRWVAIESDLSGRFEVYVRPYPNLEGGQWQISTEGGRQPLWSPSGQELFFMGLDGALMRADINIGTTVHAGTPQRVLPPGYFVGTQSVRFEGRQYDISQDGRRLLMVKLDAAAPTPTMIVVQHFASIFAERHSE
jgi:serine/threonine-protein kinase